MYIHVYIYMEREREIIKTSTCSQTPFPLQSPLADSPPHAHRPPTASLINAKVVEPMWPELKLKRKRSASPLR